jgi:hypothetical protein
MNDLVTYLSWVEPEAFSTAVSVPSPPPSSKPTSVDNIFKTLLEKVTSVETEVASLRQENNKLKLGFDRSLEDQRKSFKATQEDQARRVAELEKTVDRLHWSQSSFDRFLSSLLTLGATWKLFSWLYSCVCSCCGSARREEE